MVGVMVVLTPWQFPSMQFFLSYFLYLDPQNPKKSGTKQLTLFACMLIRACGGHCGLVHVTIVSTVTFFLKIIKVEKFARLSLESKFPAGRL